MFLNTGIMECSRICKITCYALQLVLTAVLFLMLISGSNQQSNTTTGDCWGKRTSSHNTCKTLLKQNVTKEWCCSKYSGEGISWTNESYSFSDIFKYTNLKSGIPNCEACRGESESDSCDDMNCAPNKKCVMKNDKPRCVCSPNCSKAVEEPKGKVCGTNFRSYNHKCVMLKEACRSGETIELAYYGDCQESCDAVVCPELQRCVEVQDGRPLCVSCNMPCPPTNNKDQTNVNNYVCGNDSITYESLCQLKQEACLRDEVIEVINEGQCEGLSSCDDLSCVEKNGCVMDEGVPRCILCDYECVGWRSSYSVCAFDDNTYDNWCHLREHICNTSQYIEMRGFGICGDGDLYELEEGTEGSTIDDNSILFQQLFGPDDQVESDFLNSTDGMPFYNSTGATEEDTYQEENGEQFNQEELIND